MSAEVVRLPSGEGLVEHLAWVAGGAVTQVMDRYGAAAAGLTPLVWRIDDPRTQGRQWPAVSRMAICGAPRLDDPNPGATARAWAVQLGLVTDDAWGRGIEVWSGEVDGMSVRVWAWTPAGGDGR